MNDDDNYGEEPIQQPENGHNEESFTRHEHKSICALLESHTRGFRDPETLASFSMNNKKIHLRYSTHFDLREYLESIQEYLEERRGIKVVEYSLVQELGARGETPHTHCALRFDNPLRLGKEDVAFFDYEGNHPHIKLILDETHWQNAIRYHRKEPSSRPLSNVVPKAASTRTQVPENSGNPQTPPTGAGEAIMIGTARIVLYLDDGKGGKKKKNHLALSEMEALATEDELIVALEALGIIQKHNLYIKPFLRVKERQRREQMANQMPKLRSLKPFQEEQMAELRHPLFLRENRSITWIYDQQGGSGKTELAKEIRAAFDAIIISDSSVDSVKYIISKSIDAGKVPKVIVFTIPRGAHISDSYYILLEELRDGIFTVMKYDSKEVAMPPPRILVLANNPPKDSKLTADRWDIKGVDSFGMSIGTRFCGTSILNVLRDMDIIHRKAKGLPERTEEEDFLMLPSSPLSPSTQIIPVERFACCVKENIFQKASQAFEKGKILEFVASIVPVASTNDLIPTIGGTRPPTDREVALGMASALRTQERDMTPEERNKWQTIRRDGKKALIAPRSGVDFEDPVIQRCIEEETKRLFPNAKSQGAGTAPPASNG